MWCVGQFCISHYLTVALSFKSMLTLFSTFMSFLSGCMYYIMYLETLLFVVQLNVFISLLWFLLSLLNCVPYLPTCQRALRAYVPRCLACLRAHVPMGLACLRVYVPTCLACLRVYVPTCLACFLCLRSYVLTWCNYK